MAVEVDEARARRPCRSRRSSVRRAPAAASPGARTRIRPSTTATEPARPGAPGAVDDRPAGDEQVRVLGHRATIADGDLRRRLPERGQRPPDECLQPPPCGRGIDHRRAQAARADGMASGQRAFAPGSQSRIPSASSISQAGSPAMSSARSGPNSSARLTRQWAASTAAGPTQALTQSTTPCSRPPDQSRLPGWKSRSHDAARAPDG